MSYLKIIIHNLIGNNEEFTAEHQFFNATCIVAVISTFFAFLAEGLLFPLRSIIFISVVVCIYYFTRIQKRYGNIFLALFIISVLTFLSITWFNNSGSKGSVIYFYLATTTFILFMTGIWIKIVFVILLLLNVSFLFIAEHFTLLKIDQYENNNARIIDIYFCFIIVSLILAFVVGNIRRLYYRERNNTFTLIEEYRNRSENHKDELNNKISFLSLKEREIFQMIIEGKSNKEIAAVLNVSLGTVKTHINNMYKKLGARNRSEVISMGNNNQ